MIAIGCDHAAVELKNQIISSIKAKGLEVKDFGTMDSASVDYPDIAHAVAKSVAAGECEKGILICGTGIGMCISANKVKGVRCASCFDEFSAAMCREHNNANMIALGARVLTPEKALSIAEVFLTTPFSSDERHTRRVDKIMKIEDEYFK